MYTALKELIAAYVITISFVKDIVCIRLLNDVYRTIP